MEIQSFTKEVVFNDQKPTISMMLESEFSKEIRIAMKKGQEMKEHKTPYPIIVHILSGNINFGVEGNQHTLSTGDVISLKGGIPHNLVANEDSIIRLTLSKDDTHKRVEKVAHQ